MIALTWNNEDGSRDYQECVNLVDIKACIKQVVIPGGGVINSIRVHKVSKSFDVQDDLQIIAGRDIFLEF